MSTVLESSVVRIYKNSGEVVGAGFLVSHKHILTCAHVVCDALGIIRTTVEMPTGEVGEVSFDFPLLAAGQILKARVVFWRPVNENELEEDIAALELENPLPQKAQPVLLVPSENVWGHPFKVFGFPRGQSNGVWASGVLREATAKGWVQLEGVKEAGFQLEGGFSGGLVWDQELQLVAGMAVAADKLRPEARAGFIISAKVLIKAWDVLAQRAIDACPYRGLSAFREEDAPFFFGREELTKELVAAVQNYKIVPAIGPSGSGKSSAVFAGLIPQLRSQQNWLIEGFRPKNHPFNELARALLRLTAPEAGTKQEISEAIALAKQLKEEASALETWVSSILERKPQARLLLVADQFEEIFQTADRQLFLKRLLDVVRKIPKLTLLFTMRADFMENALSDPILAEALDNDVKVKPMSPQQLQDAIEKPARGLVQIEAGLTTRILEDALTETISSSYTVDNGEEQKTEKEGYLPLVEFALEKLWKKQENGRLTHHAYEEIKGVKGAIAQHASQGFKKLSKSDQKKARQIFLQLVHPGENNLHTRQIATRSQLGEDKWSLVTYLAGEDCRLVVTNRNEVTKEETVELIHEALIREWQLLGDWIQDNREFRIWQEQLRTEMRQWKEAKENKDGELLRKAPLTRAEYWFQERGDELSQLEQEFIRESVKRRDRDRRQTILGLVTGLVTVSMFAVGAVWQGLEAEKQREIAVSERIEAEKQRIEAEKQREIAVAGERNAEMRARIATLDSRLVSGEESLNLQLEVIAAGKELKEASWATYDNRLRGANLLREMLMKWREYNSIEAHQDGVNSVVFSPDGKYLASASWDKTVKLWKASDGSLLRTLQGHQSWVNSVVFSPDGKYLASASRDKTVKLWKASDGSLVRTIEGHESSVNSVAFSPDGKYLASASADKTVKLWKSSDGSWLHTIEGHQSSVNSVAFSPDEKHLASASYDGTVKLWKSSDGSLVRTIQEPSREVVSSVVFSPDGKYLASAGRYQTVKLWKAEDGSWLHTFLGNGIFSKDQGQVESVVFSPDGKYLASAGADKIVTFWKAEDGSLVRTLSGHQSWLKSVVFSPDGKYLASASVDGTVKLWKGDNGSLVHTLSGHQIWVKSVVFSPDGKYLASASSKTVKLWKGDNGSLLHTLSGHQSWINSAVLSPDGTYLASASEDKTIKLWNAEDGSLLHTLQGHQDGVYNVVFSPDETYLASASTDKTVKLWNAEDGSLLYTLSGHSAEVVFSPDGKYLASASYDGTVKLWKVSDGSWLHTLQGHQNREFYFPNGVHIVVFSPDGKYLASVSKDKTVELWKAEDGSWLHTLSGHQSWITSVVFSPDGKYLASASADGTVKLWKAEDGSLVHTLSGVHIVFSPDGKYLASSAGRTVKLWKASDGSWLHTLSGHQSWITSVVFSPDGKYLASASDDKTVKLWNLNLEDLLLRACKDMRGYLKNSPNATDDRRRLCNIQPSAPVLVYQGKELARNGDVEGAVAKFQKALELDPNLNIDASSWNELCWYGSLHDHATDIMFACEKAVVLAPEDEKIRDGRGLARALTGDTEGAIEDFQAFIQWTENTILEERRKRRQGWIDALRRGENPFTPEVLESLRRDRF